MSTPDGSPTPPVVTGPPARRDEAAVATHRHARWRVFRDVLVFQAKLLVDGLKDVVLAPISVFAALIGIILHRRDPGRHFYSTLRAGRAFDRWVNLFAAAGDPGEDDGLDTYVAKLEAALAERHGRGGLTAAAKNAVDRAIDAISVGETGPQQTVPLDPDARESEPESPP